MKKLINDPGAFVDEMLEGILLAHPDQLRAVGADRRSIVRADAPVAGRVGIVTGGGSGHLPVFLGFVGVGLCSGVAVGNVFSSPSMDQILEATRGVDGGAGVLYLYGNYGGDVLNFDLAGELADAEGITVETVLVADDVASAPADRADARRGVAGMFFAFKCAGAVADAGGSLAEVAEAARHALAGTRSMGVGLSPTILPAAGKPTFELADGEMEIGIGIHGEPGVRRAPLETADEVADDLLGAIATDLGLGGRPGRGPRQRPRRDAARGAVHPLSPRPRGSGRARRDGPPAVHRGVRDQPRDGRRLAHRAARRRPHRRLARRAGQLALLPVVTGRSR